MAKDVTAVFFTHTCHDCQKPLQAEAANAAIWANISSATSVLGHTRHS